MTTNDDDLRKLIEEEFAIDGGQELELGDDFDMDLGATDLSESLSIPGFLIFSLMMIRLLMKLF